MRPVDQYPIYELGGALQILKEVASHIEEEPPLSLNRFAALWFAEYRLKALLDGRPFQISFCRNSARSIVHHTSALLHASKGKTLSEGSALALYGDDSWRWFSLRGDIEAFEHQFAAELQRMATYAVPDIGIFKTESLVDAADRHIHESVRAEVPTFAITEIQAAGRCLAFGLCSASGFHSARAVECVLREYHGHFLPTANSADLTMGNMASALADMHKAKQKAENLPKQNTVRHIKDFVDYDRNPLMHKNVELQEIHAVTLFNSAASVIVEMTKEISDSLQRDDGPLLKGLEIPKVEPTKAVTASPKASASGE